MGALRWLRVTLRWHVVTSSHYSYPKVPKSDPKMVLWPSVTYGDPKVTQSNPKVKFGDTKVTYSDPKVTYSDL